MRIEKKSEGNVLVISLDGRLDTNTSHDLEKEVASLDGVFSLIFDFERLDYISSAGLRVLLSCQKRMEKQGTMVVKKANEDVKEVFDITGFSNIITIE